MNKETPKLPDQKLLFTDVEIDEDAYRQRIRYMALGLLSNRDLPREICERVGKAVRHMQKAEAVLAGRVDPRKKKPTMEERQVIASAARIFDLTGNRSSLRSARESLEQLSKALMTQLGTHTEKGPIFGRKGSQSLADYEKQIAAMDIDERFLRSGKRQRLFLGASLLYFLEYITIRPKGTTREDPAVNQYCSARDKGKKLFKQLANPVKVQLP